MNENKKYKNDLNKKNKLNNLHLKQKPQFIDNENKKLNDENNNNKYIISNNKTDNLNVETGDVGKKNIPSFDELK